MSSVPSALKEGHPTHIPFQVSNVNCFNVLFEHSMCVGGGKLFMWVDIDKHTSVSGAK